MDHIPIYIQGTAWADQSIKINGFKSSRKCRF